MSAERSGLRGALFALALAAAWPASAAPTSPMAFVRGIYDQYIADTNKVAPDQDTTERYYTPRLKTLVAHARDTTPEGDAPCGLDFVFWVDGQDYDFKHVDLTEQRGPDATDVVVAKFQSLGQPHEVHFTFEKIGRQWLLDDAASVIGTKWDFAKLLTCQG